MCSYSLKIHCSNVLIMHVSKKKIMDIQDKQESSKSKPPNYLSCT